MQGLSEIMEQNTVKECGAAGSKISIVVPLYNVEHYIERCIKSLLNQTYRNLEIILVDDGSTDHSGGICDHYACMDSRITVIHKENGGVVSARKTGAKLATGDYVCGVDGDDWIEPERMRHFAEQGAATGADMVYMEGYYKEYAKRSDLIRSGIPEGLYAGQEVMERLFPLLIDTKSCFRRPIRGTQWCWGTRRELFQRIWEKIDERVSMGEDHAHLILCMLEAETVCLMREEGYHYVMREDSVTHTLDSASLEGLKRWFGLVKKEMGARRCRDELHLHMAFLKIWYIMNCDYSILLKKPREFLYPYPRVKKGSRVAVYGAGTVGTLLVKALSQNADFKTACWVDRYSAGQRTDGCTVEPVSALLNTEFDHVAIAVLDRDIVEEIEKSLLESGIPEEKIAKMDAGAICGEDVPKGF